MAQYSRTVLTDAGVILARRIMDDETLTMEFTRIQTGSGEYSSGEDIASRTSLKAPKQSFPISSRSVTSEQVLHLKYVVSNVNPDLSPLTVGYYVRELAIYAQVSGEAEILYAIAIADADSADYLPEYDELQPTTITMDWFLPVGNAEQINVYASPDAYALAEDLEALALVVDDKLDADGDSAGNTVTFTSSDVPDSSVTKDTGWTTSGALSSGETHESFMTKISRMIKNIRWIYKLIGTTDISSIGNGTITGGLSSLNDSLSLAIKDESAQTIADANLMATNRKFTIGRYSADSLNTPYKAGLTGNLSEGAILNYGGWVAAGSFYASQVAMVNGGNIYERHCSNTQWSAWQKL